MMGTKLLFNAATRPLSSSLYELFLPRGTLSRKKSLPKRLNAIQVFRDAIEKTFPKIEGDFVGTHKWIVVINQPCLHNSDNCPKNRYRIRQSTSTKSRESITASEHYTAYGYLAVNAGRLQSTKGMESVFSNRWWMHVDAEKRTVYGPHPRQGKMWKKRISEGNIVHLAGPFKF